MSCLHASPVTAPVHAETDKKKKTKRQKGRCNLQRRRHRKDAFYLVRLRFITKMPLGVCVCVTQLFCVAVSGAACCVESGPPSQPTGRRSSARTTRRARTLFSNYRLCYLSKYITGDRLVLRHLEEAVQRWTHGSACN